MRRRKATVTSVRARKVDKVILTFSEYNFFSERVRVNSVKTVSTRISPRCIKCAGEEGGRNDSPSQTRVERVEQSQFEIVFTRISPHPTPPPMRNLYGPHHRNLCLLSSTKCTPSRPRCARRCKCGHCCGPLSRVEYIMAAALFYSSF